MERRPTRYKSTDTLLPDTTLFRSSAWSTLGELHLSGAFPGADPAAGIEYLQRAHQAGIASATAHLGQAYLEGRRSEEHTSELQSLMRISYAVFCLTKKNYFHFLFLTVFSFLFLLFLYFIFYL